MSDASLGDTVDEDGTAPPTALAPDEVVVRGTSLGRYVLLEHVGSGGMGVVFAAYDPDLDRRVALKVLRAHVRDSRSASVGRSRLLREAQAIAAVHHENVIAVHDVGTVDDRVFIAMEFIEGGTLTQWVAEQRPLLDAVVSVFVRAGRGLAAAHAQGLVHRDFKPDNVLVGRDGRVCVVDFGLARRSSARAGAEVHDTRPCVAETGGGHTRLRGSSLTRTGAVVGTPAYMAPEQHLGAAATERSDQFSFCVSLYEAAYGHRPFRGASHAELVVNLTEGRVRPAPRDAKVPQWVRRVLLRGLSLDPAQRFPSMPALLVALNPTHHKRRRGWIAAAAAVVGLTAAALVGWGAPGGEDARTRCGRATQHLRGVWDGTTQARFARAFKATDKAFAVEAWDGTFVALDEYTTRWVSARVDACEATHLRGEQSEMLLDLRMRCLDDRLEGVRAVASLFRHADAAIVAGAVDAVHSLARLEDCADLERLAARGPEPMDAQQRQLAARSGRALAEARVLVEAQRLAPALRRIEAALSSAVAVESAPLQVAALLVQSDAYEAADDLVAARQSLWRALLLAEASGDDLSVARAWTDLVWLDGYRGARFEAGHAAAEHAQAVLDRIGGDRDLRALLVSRQADLAYAEGDYPAALAQHLQALALREAADGLDHPATADSRTGVGHALVQLQRYPEALAHYEAARTILVRSYGAQHPHLARALTNIGVTQEYLADLVASRRTHEEALRVAEQAYGPDHTAVAEILNNYAAVLHLQGHYTRAREAFERAKLIWERAYGHDHPDVGMALFNLAVVAEDQGQRESAITLQSEALAVREAAQGERHPDVAESLHHLAVLLAGPISAHGGVADARHTLAVAHLRRALAIRNVAVGPNAAETLETQELLRTLSGPR